MRAPGGRALGLAAIALAIAFNVPYAILGVTYDYPAILRRPAGEALARYAQGGPGLVLTWYAFGLTALALVPLAFALATTAGRLQRRPGLALGGALSGALAGFAQAVGLWRWVFVVPGLARAHAAPGATPEAQRAAERAFDLLNQYGGVAIGEHLGQWLTALFVLLLAMAQRGEGAPRTAWTGLVTAALLALGTGEGLALALDGPGAPFSVATILGFLGLSIWLIATGVGLLRRPSASAA